MATLFAFAGLPGSGKSSLARALARQRGATWLRIDSIEQALRDSGLATGDVGPAGYVAGYALARDNLALGLDVVADSVNPVPESRAGWAQAASGHRLVNVEITCSDTTEHRHRIETRRIDVPGLAGPDWQAVTSRHYAAWDTPPVRVDTAGRTVEACVEELLSKVSVFFF